MSRPVWFLAHNQQTELSQLRQLPFVREFEFPESILQLWGLPTVQTSNLAPSMRWILHKNPIIANAHTGAIFLQTFPKAPSPYQCESYTCKPNNHSMQAVHASQWYDFHIQSCRCLVTPTTRPWPSALHSLHQHSSLRKRRGVNQPRSCRSCKGSGLKSQLRSGLS